MEVRWLVSRSTAFYYITPPSTAGYTSIIIYEDQSNKTRRNYIGINYIQILPPSTDRDLMYQLDGCHNTSPNKNRWQKNFDFFLL